MKSFLSVIFALLLTTQAKAQSDAFESARREIRANDIKAKMAVDFEFERMKQRSDYSKTLASATKDDLVVLWIKIENPDAYQWFKAEYPTAKHAWVESTQDTGPGIVIGRHNGQTVERIKEIGGSTLTSKEVIRGLTATRPTLEQKLSPVVSRSTGGGSLHSHTCRNGHTWWHSSSDPNASHNCPTCGAFENRVSSIAPPKLFALPGNCANGNCPTPR